MEGAVGLEELPPIERGPQIAQMPGKSHRLEIGAVSRLISQTFQFFLDGPIEASVDGYRNAFLHASNAALSGSLQEGADDILLWFAPDDNVYGWYSDFPGVWDKRSDFNVQVFADFPTRHDCEDFYKYQKKLTRR